MLGLEHMDALSAAEPSSVTTCQCVSGHRQVVHLCGYLPDGTVHLLWVLAEEASAAAVQTLGRAASSLLSSFPC